MKKKVLLAVIIIFTISTVFIIWDNNRIVTSRHSIESDRITEPLQIVQISDYHNCERLGEKLVRRVKRESPDVIVITGDFIDGSKANYDDALNIAGQLTRIAPTYYVTGNHEIADLTSDYRDELKDLGVEILSGGKANLKGNVDLYGIEDLYMHGSIQAELEKLHIDKDKYNLLLSHRPEAFLSYAQTDFDLVLTGHAHGGQFRIPFIGGLVAPDQGFFPEYDSGAYEKNGTTMIVSRGIGNSLIPVRVNNPAEIVSIKILPASKQ